MVKEDPKMVCVMGKLCCSFSCNANQQILGFQPWTNRNHDESEDGDIYEYNSSGMTLIEVDKMRFFPHQLLLFFNHPSQSSCRFSLFDWLMQEIFEKYRNSCTFSIIVAVLWCRGNAICDHGVNRLSWASGKIWNGYWAGIVIAVPNMTWLIGLGVSWYFEPCVGLPSLVDIPYMLLWFYFELLWVYAHQ